MRLYVESVHALKVPYRGLEIERHCLFCDTVDIHFEGRCNSGRCQHTSNGAACNVSRFSHLGVLDHDWVAGHYEPRHITEHSDAFDAIVDRAREVGLPTMYTCDLYLDYQRLTSTGLWKGEVAPDCFIWAVRDTGTDIITPKTGAVTERYLEANQRFFHWNGYTLEETDRDTARCLLAAYRIGAPA